jgi:hypothetical protein
MILQVFADARGIDQRCDPMLVQAGGRADAGQLQDGAASRSRRRPAGFRGARGNKGAAAARELDAAADFSPPCSVARSTAFRRGSRS